MWYGGDYNPEQWPDDVQAEDVTLMRRAGVTMVTVGVFAWSWLEPEPGRYEFGWLDRVLDRLAAAGIGVVLATPTASPPPWFSLAHPDALPVTADGVRLSHGSRDTYCASAPAYRDAARRIAAALAGRYGGHPALRLWHVHNEYGTTCHCEVTADAFRRWLRDRYGSLDTLNDVWTTAFWSQRYTDWAQIRPPRATQYLPNPAQVLDFRRFTSDELLAAYVEQRDILRPTAPVTTNYVLGGWVPVNHARWAREVDIVAVDHYPADPGPGAEEETAFAADLARGWARHSPGAPDWILMETAPNLIYAAGRMHTKEPGRMARHSLAAVARGSRGAMFFQWRAPRGGAELFHSALVPHAGPDSRVFREAVGLGEQMRRVAPAAAGRVVAQVAIGYDEESAWALQAPGLPAAGLDPLDEARRAHRVLWRRGVTADVVGAPADLSAYAMVVLPMHYLMSDAQAAVVRDWVGRGGRLVVTYLSGIADEFGRVRLGGYPGALRDVLGVRVEEFHPLPPDASIALTAATAATAGPDSAAGASAGPDLVAGDSAGPDGVAAAAVGPGAAGRVGGWCGDRWSETVHAEGADVVARYAGGVLDGRPAVTRNRYGRGVAWYVSTRLAEPALDDLLATVAADAGVVPACDGLPPGVEAVRRGAWLFLLNHTDAAQSVPAEGVDVLTGAPVAGRAELPPGGVVVVHTPPR